MLRRLVERLGVDYDQWRALVIAMARMDFRVTRVEGSTVSANTNEGHHARLWSLGVMYLMMGIAATILVAVLRDVMLTGTIVLT